MVVPIQLAGQPFNRLTYLGLGKEGVQFHSHKLLPSVLRLGSEGLYRATWVLAGCLLRE